MDQELEDLLSEAQMLHQEAKASANRARVLLQLAARHKDRVESTVQRRTQDEREQTEQE